MDFAANLRLLSTEEGGRETAVRPGYRSVLRFGEPDSEAWGVEITFDAQAELAPGEAAAVHIQAWADPPAPEVGTPIQLYEGARLVGSGTVREYRCASLLSPDKDFCGNFCPPAGSELI